MNSLYTYSQSLDDVCYLISTDVGTDDVGNQIETPTEKMCFCSEISTSAKEFFSASQQDLNPELTLLIDTLSYSGETKVKYDEKLYKVYRCYGRAEGLTELYLSESR